MVMVQFLAGVDISLAHSQAAQGKCLASTPYGSMKYIEISPIESAAGMRGKYQQSRAGNSKESMGRSEKDETS